MEALVEGCCGLDVHQATVVACLLVGPPGRKPHKEVRTFATVTQELLALRDWLHAAGCTHVGMESTGIYWKPVYAVLEDTFEVIVGNAHHIKNVPGRKTDVKDSEWIADLVRHGLIAKSFVPPKPIRALRDLLRYRRKLVENRSAERNRLLKLLETANIKLASVVSDVFGVSGIRMLRAILDGTATPHEMAQLARGRMRTKIAALTLALDGRCDEHHRFLLRMQLARLDEMDAHLAELDHRIDTHLGSYQVQRELLTQIPGVDRMLAATLIAEVGVDMRVFGNPHRLVAWAGVCPGNYESAGKRKHGRVRNGNVHLKTALVEAANSARNQRGTYLKDKYFRLKARRGPQRAAVAIGRKILIAAYHMLATGVAYNDLGAAYLDQLSRTRVAGNLVRRLQRLGYTVTVAPSPA